MLSEKPFTANADQAMAVREVAETSTGSIVEGFHFLHHLVDQVYAAAGFPPRGTG